MRRDGRRRGPGRRILRGAALALLCYAVISFTVTPFVLRQMFPRTGTADPAALEGLRRVPFSSGERTLQAYVLDADDPAGVALLLHGMNADASRMARAMRMLAGKGWTAVAVDLTGAGGSGGDWTRGLQQGLFDGRAALAWMESQPQWDGLPVVAFGHSAGGWAAGMLAADARVSGVVVLAAFDRPVTQMLSWANRYTGPLAWAEAPFLRLWEAICFGAEADASAAEAVGGSGKPALVIQGDADKTVPPGVRLSERLTGETPGAVLLLPEDAGHGLDSLLDALPAETLDGFLEAVTKRP